MLLIALAAIWLVLVAFVLTMCRVAARTDAANADRGGKVAPPSRRDRRPAEFA